MSKQRPSNTEVRQLMDRHGLTSARVADIIDVNSRTIRRYTGDPETQGAKQMPLATWTFLRLVVGEVTLAEVRQELKFEDGGSED